MPEGVEIEFYRRAAESAVGRTIESVDTPDAWFLKEGATPEAVTAACVGQVIVAARRRGKLLILDLDSGERLGLRFGMTGRLVVDGTAAIAYLEYTTKRSDPKWIRFGLVFNDGGYLVINDPRRLGGVILDPNEDGLGQDVFDVDPATFRSRVLVGDVAVKARLLDQRRIAGVGNLICDETLWRAGIDPARSAGSLSEDEGSKLFETLREVLADFLSDGGSHTGRLHSARVRGGRCPLDGEPLMRREIGGRTTYWCVRHQR
ncbi:MAG: formamidopyrimidine-DNA glycosylase [Actinomycetota bacterium]|nr:formamidopyrimidine-DNA glycosylase [Actinomycetota bacterium]